MALTDCLKAYYTSFKRLARYKRDSAHRILKARQKATENLEGLGDIESLRKKYERQKRFPPGDGLDLFAAEILEEMLGATEPQPAMLYETVYVYAFALFEGYLLDVLTALLVHKPKLGSGKPPEKDAHGLCIGSLVKRNKKYQKRFGLDLSKDVSCEGIESLADVDQLREKRHCLIHRAGKASPTLVALAGDGRITEGEPVSIGHADCEKVFIVTARMVDTIFVQLGATHCAKMPHRPGWCQVRVMGGNSKESGK